APNTTAWTIQPTPSPTGAQGDIGLFGVSCTSARACTAFGDNRINADTGMTLEERWDGTAWTIETTPNPTSATRSSLEGVSCASATACTATGFSSDSPGTQVTLAEHWDGTTWTIQDTPPTGTQGSD